MVTLIGLHLMNHAVNAGIAFERGGMEFEAGADVIDSGEAIGRIFKGDAATEIRRLFAGPFLPQALVRPGLIPFVPDVPRLRFHRARISRIEKVGGRSPTINESGHLLRVLPVRQMSQHSSRVYGLEQHGI